MRSRAFVKTLLYAVMLLSFVLAIVPGALAQRADSPAVVAPAKEATAEWDAFKRAHPDSMIEWDGKTGRPQKLSNFVSKAYAGTPEERAKAFLKENRSLFGVKADLSDIKNIKTQKTAVKGKTGIDYVTFQQFYDNVPIVGAETILHMTETGKVFRVYSRYYPAVTPANTRKLSKEKAIDVVPAKVKKTMLPGDRETAALVLYLKDSAFFYAWQVQAGSWRYYINAETGDVIEAVETMLYQRTCTGQVYTENSCDTPTRITGNLPNLDTSGNLEGTNFDVLPSSGSRATSTTCSYSFSVTDGKFDQTEVYYQLERAMAYFGGLGFTPNPAQTTAYTNNALMTCNAAYNWGGNYFVFGPASDGGCSGLTCNNPSHDGDIIVHEYAHQVVHQTSGINGAQHWPASIHEAVADYFSDSYFNDPCAAEPFDKNCNTCLRNANNTKKLPGDANWTDPHIMGLILSGALWDIRKDTGQSFTDWVAYEALKGLPADADFTDYATNALDVVAAKIDDIDNWLVKLILIIAQVSMRDHFCAHGITLASPYACP